MGGVQTEWSRTTMSTNNILTHFRIYSSSNENGLNYSFVLTTAQLFKIMGCCAAKNLVLDGGVKADGPVTRTQQINHKRSSAPSSRTKPGQRSTKNKEIISTDGIDILSDDSGSKSGNKFDIFIVKQEHTQKDGNNKNGATTQGKNETGNRKRSQDKENVNPGANYARNNKKAKTVQNQDSSEHIVDLFQASSVKGLPQNKDAKPSQKKVINHEGVYDTLDIDSINSNESTTTHAGFNDPAVIEAFDDIFGSGDQFKTLKGTPELQRKKKVHVIPTGLEEDEIGSAIGRKGLLTLGGTSNISDPTSPRSDASQTFEVEVKGEDGDQISNDIDMMSDDSGYVLCETDADPTIIDTNRTKLIEVLPNGDLRTIHVNQEFHNNRNQAQYENKPSKANYGMFHFGKPKPMDPPKNQRNRGDNSRLSNTLNEEHSIIGAIPPAVGLSNGIQGLLHVAPADKSKSTYSYQYKGDSPSTNKRPGTSNGKNRNPPEKENDPPPNTNKVRGLIQVMPTDNPTKYSYKPPPSRSSRRESNRDPDITEFQSKILSDISTSNNNNELDSDEEIKINLTPERSRKNRPKSSYSVRRHSTYETQPHRLESEDYSNLTTQKSGSTIGLQGDSLNLYGNVTDTDVTVNIMSNKAARVLGLETEMESSRPPLVPCDETENSNTNQKDLSHLKFPKENMILRTNTKARGMNSVMDTRLGSNRREFGTHVTERAMLPGWSRHLPP